MISAIVCVDNNWGIGYQGNLLAHIPEDMKFFKETTTNNVVIMGRKTYDSLPLKPLPNRINIVITSRVDNYEIDKNGTIFVSMDFIKLYLSTLPMSSPINYYIIGGAQIYKELLPYCHTSYVTKVNHSYDNVDTYFPNLDKDENWEMWIETHRMKNKYCGIEYELHIYENIKI